MSDFSIMAAQLAGLRRPGSTSARRNTSAPSSKTEQIRRLLADMGPLTALSIAVQLDIEGGSGLVSALVANDLRKGRIERIGDCYRLVESWDEQLQAELSDAAAFLRRNGYTVTKPISPTKKEAND